jgi:hypothetical protein
MPNHKDRVRSVSSLLLQPVASCFVAALLAIFAVAAGPRPALAAATGGFDAWYVLNVNGDKAGWIHRASRTLEDGSVEFVEQSHLRIGRGEQSITMTDRTVTVESAAGEIRSILRVRDLGAAEVRETYTFEGDEVRVRVDRDGAGSQERTIERPGGGWLTPAAARRYFASRLRAGAKTITYETLTAEDGRLTVSEETWERAADAGEPLVIEFEERRIETIEGVARSAAAPGVEARVWIDPAGLPVRTSAQVGGIAVEERIATRNDALADWQGPEILVSSLIKPTGRRLDTLPRGGRGLKGAAYTLSVEDGVFVDLPPVTSAQTVERIDERSVRVVVSLTGPQAPAELTPTEHDALLAASVIADSDDPFIERLTERALREAGLGLIESSDAERAEALRRFVFSYIAGKNLDSGYASASEVARVRSGDCTEHTVLLVAMLREAGIPARGADGLIFADALGNDAFDDEGADAHRGAFGFHMWAQALIESDDGKRLWLDLDAAWDEPMDAMRIALATSDLADGDGLASGLTIARLIGNLSIRVDELGPDVEPLREGEREQAGAAR